MNVNSNEERKVFTKEVTEKQETIIPSPLTLILIIMTSIFLFFSIINKNWCWVVFFTIALCFSAFLRVISCISNTGFTLTIEDSTLTYDSNKETIIFQIPCSLKIGMGWIEISDGSFDFTLFYDNEEERNKIIEFLKDAI